MTTSHSKLLSAWTPDKQTAWRAQHPAQALTLHMLLDTSGSMDGHMDALSKGYNLYLRWLQRHGPPMALLDTRFFTTQITAAQPLALGGAPALTPQTRTPSGGTALYDAVGTIVSTASQPGQHVLVVFTDGQDEDSTHWTAAQVHTLLTTVQQESGWLCVFLGAFAAALEVARSMGFLPGNCLTFPNEKLPEAFTTLQQATQRYLAAIPQDRKRLAQGGIF